ncbi:hypothetical protein ACSHWI_16015, partial [Methylococcus sp. S2T]|uniref:hypothetical protein n=1 Tax=Methylococcus sp. S2T TaxID=3438967 RepID=UPI003EDA4B2E
AAGIEIADLRKCLGGRRLQDIGALEVVILQQRLVDLADDEALVGTVGAGRIEVLGALGQRGIQDVALGIGRRVRTVERSL